MSKVTTAAEYTHCGYTQSLQITEIEGYYGTSLQIRIVGEDGREFSVLRLGADFTKGLEKFFIERAEARDKAEFAKAQAAADPIPTDGGEEDASWGEPADDYDEGVPALA